MDKTEGGMNFQLQFSPVVPLPSESLREINAWRKIFYLTQLIGQDPNRYGGFCYGNISQRLLSYDSSGQQISFIISGTKTGDLPDLNENHYATVTACHTGQNLIVAEGPIHPSSESLTHGILYSLDHTLQSVIHAYSSDIWCHADRLGIPFTESSAEYGTPGMANEIWRLFSETPVRNQGIFVMGGLEDGVVSFGKTIEEASMILLHYLALSFYA